MSISRHLLVLMGALVAAGTSPAAPDPLDAKVAVPPLNHRSVFDGYRGHDDVKPVSWRQANDSVGRIGGWRAYAREAAASQPAATPPGPAASGGAGRHGHH
ncbi:MAG: hypothetical protein U1E89_04075 [Burkholderiaceae bacterium]